VTLADSIAANLDCNATTAGNQAISSTLAPGAVVTCTATYTVTQADIDAGGNFDSADVGTAFDVIRNVATASSTQTGSKNDDTETPVAPAPDLSIVKTVTDLTNPNGSDDADNIVDQAGDVIHYQIVVTNTGNTTLTGVTLVDSIAANLDCNATTAGNQAIPSTLAPGAVVTCTATYTVTQADIDAGGNFDSTVPPDALNDVIRNVATASSNETGSEDDDVTAPVKAQPGIVTTDTLIPQDSIVLSNLTTGATGTLYAELRINETCDQDETPAYSKTWSGAAFTGNGTYTTDNTVAVSTDATIRWCVSYSGDDHNAAIPLDDHNEVVTVDFHPFEAAAAGLGFALPLLAWGLWSRRKRDTAA
jgi:uncharacterized repeat protein (TIGR01451 family)